MADTYGAVHRALYAKLTTALSPLSCPVLDSAPLNQPMPYAKFGQHTADPDDTFRDTYTVHRIVLLFFTGPNAGSSGAVRGKAQCRLIVEAARNALHHVKLALDAGTSVRCQVERINIDDGPDVVTAEGSMIVRVDVAE